MPTVLVIDRDGVERELAAPDGVPLMEPLRDMDDGVAAICGGMCSCATCHVYVDADWLPRLPAIMSDERELLSELTHYREDSRLSCQLEFTEALAGLRRIATLRSSAVPSTSTSTMPALDFWRCRRGASCRRDNTYCAATVACPTKPISLRGVKKRARTVWSAPSGASMNAVSALFSSRATASICASVSSSALSTTPVGLPVKGSRVKASTWWTWIFRDIRQF